MGKKKYINDRSPVRLGSGEGGFGKRKGREKKMRRERVEKPRQSAFEKGGGGGRGKEKKKRIGGVLGTLIDFAGCHQNPMCLIPHFRGLPSH